MKKDAVLMCLNIPRDITQENLYELFSAAGPIDDIYFSQSGKSVFIIYEYEEAVSTAKEIFKEVKLYGRPIRMYSKSDIETIYTKRTELVNLKRKNDSEIGPPNKRKYDESSCQHVSQNRYRNILEDEDTFPIIPDRISEDRFKSETVSFKRENPYLTASRNSYHGRSDLLPSVRKTTHNMKNVYERESGIPNVSFSNFERNDYRGSHCFSKNDHRRPDEECRSSSYTNASRRINFEIKNPYSNPAFQHERQNEISRRNYRTYSNSHEYEEDRERHKEKRNYKYYPKYPDGSSNSNIYRHPKYNNDSRQYRRH